MLVSYSWSTPLLYNLLILYEKGLCHTRFEFIDITNRQEMQTLKYCRRCGKELSTIERDLFDDNKLVECRDCWINQNFGPTKQDENDDSKAS